MHEIQKNLLALSRNINLGERSLRDIGRLIGVDHPEKVKHHLEQLEKKGFITIDRANKTIRNVNDNQSVEQAFVNVPIVGAANCGPADILAVENIEGHLKLSKSILKKDSVFAVKAQGNSMNKSKITGGPIEEGDYAIVDYKDTDAKHGDYVLSVIDGAANIKRYFKDENMNQIVLMSESTETHTPIYIHQDDFTEFMINGKVLQVVKQPKF